MKYLLIWAVFAAAASSLAKGKNRNVYVWFFIGLLLGPLAILALAFMKPVPV